jgi:hypothetical protein
MRNHCLDDLFTAEKRSTLSIKKNCSKPAGSNSKPNMHGNSQHPAVVRSLRSRLSANGRVTVRSVGREEDDVGSWNPKEEDSSLAYPDRSNTVTPRNLHPTSKIPTPTSPIAQAESGWFLHGWETVLCLSQSNNKACWTTRVRFSTQTYLEIESSAAQLWEGCEVDSGCQGAAGLRTAVGVGAMKWDKSAVGV